MLQLNHVTITHNNKKLLDDCTFQFKEGQPYVIVGDPGDFVVFSEAACGELKPDAGELVTWDGADRYNSCDDRHLPFYLTAIQYAQGLLNIYKHGEGQEPGVYLLESGFDTAKKDKLIRELSANDKAALRFMAVKLINAYVNVIGEPIPEIGLLAEWVDNNKDDKVIIFGVSDPDMAGVLKKELGSEIIELDRLSLS